MQEDENVDLELLEDLDERLYEIHSNPIDLNTASREQLEALEFLSDIQIENILFYAYIAGEIKSIYELQLVESLPHHVTRFLLPFVTIKPKSHTTNWNSELKRIKHHVSLSSSYKWPSDSSNVEGSLPIKAQLRYKLLAGKILSAGITADHDAGERFYGADAQGFDHYKIFAEFRPLSSCFKNIVLGTFKASFGQGLLLGDVAYGSPLEELSSSSSHGRGIRHYSGVDECKFFNGVGSTLKFGKNYELSAFYSYRQHDADTANGCFISIDESGYHTSHAMYKKRDAILMHTAALHSKFIGKRYEIGITSVYNYHALNKIVPQTPYYLYKFTGNHQFGISANYRCLLRYISFYGEFAVNQRGAFAAVNTINITPSYGTSIILNHRFFSPAYDMYFATPYGASSAGNNEHGATMGVIHQLPRNWQIKAYVDIYKHLWLNYTTKSPSVNGSLRIDANYNTWGKSSANLYVKYKYNDDENHDFLSFKARYTYKLKNISFTSGAMGSYLFQTNSYSYALVQEVKCKFLNNRLAANAMFTVFDAQTWDNRLYWYESNLPYSGYSPAIYGKGGRWYLMCRGAATEYLDIYLRFAQTIVEGSNAKLDLRNDLSLMLNFKL